MTRRAFLATVATMPSLPRLDVRGGTSGVAEIRAGFPALAQRIAGHPLAYLDNAATSLRPRAVIDAVAGFYERDNANPSPAMHTLARRSAEAQETARLTVARFLNASGPEEVIFTRGTTEGVNLVAATWGAASIGQATRSC